MYKQNYFPFTGFVSAASENCSLHKPAQVHEPPHHVLQAICVEQNQRQSKFG